MNLKNVSSISFISSKTKKQAPIDWKFLNKFQRKQMASYLVDKLLDEEVLEVKLDNKNVILTLDAKGQIQCQDKD